MAIRTRDRGSGMGVVLGVGIGGRRPELMMSFWQFGARRAVKGAGCSWFLRQELDTVLHAPP